MKNFFSKIMMKALIVCTLSVFFLSFQSCKDKTTGSIKVNGDWKFKLMNDTDVSDNQYHLTDFNDSNWKTVDLPHTANLEPLLVNNQWQGICWYRKNIDVQESFDDKKIFIELEAAMNHSKIWINGMEVTTHIGGYLPVVVDVTKYIKPNANNSIAIRLNNTDNPITGPKPLNILDFNTYGGLYRNAWLTVKNKVHISHPVLADKVAGGGIFITTPKVSEEESIIQIKTHVLNEQKTEKPIKIEHSIYYNGAFVKKQISAITHINAEKDLEFIEKITLQNAKLWSPKDPNLYTVETKVYVGNTIADEASNRFGIRAFTFKDNKLYINGNKTFLRGVNRHQEYPFIGYALSDNAQYRDAKKIKDAGFDYIRLSHYPQSPAFMDACDELGLVVVDAILGWQYYLDNDQFRAYCYRSAKELIFRDRNHPSVLAWEVSLNETKMPVFFMEKLNKIVHEQYPGENVYSCGWLDDVYDIYFQARQHKLMHPENYNASKPYSVSEYGDWEYYSTNAGLNQDKLSKTKRYETSSRQKREYGEARLLQQAYNVQEAHNDNMNTAAFSDSYWVMYDYNRGYHDDIEYSGIMDIFRIPKFAYYFYKSQKDPEDENVVHIASYWNEKSPLDIKVFSNADEVALYLNDKLISKQMPDANEISNNLKHPPFTFKLENFEVGTLKAIGYNNDKKISQHSVTTPKIPVALKVWLDKSGIAPQAGVNDVLFLYVAAVDDNGTIVPDFSENINLSSGDSIKILNKGTIKAEAGIATALIQIGKNQGSVNITAKSQNFTGDIVFTIK